MIAVVSMAFFAEALEHGDAVGNGFDAGHGTTAVSKARRTMSIKAV